MPTDYNRGRDMENEAREHLKLAQYNFNRMAVIDEEGVYSANNRGNRPSNTRQNEIESRGGQR